ncbi:MAG: helix-turn-helix transcriptional regulator [Bryobacterales bacterium]
MQRNRPPSKQSASLLFALARESETWRHGYELSLETGLKAGTLYPLLARLADRGWLEAQWETTVPAGRPPRHLYRLTTTGLQETRALALAQRTSGLTRCARLRPQREGM